MFDLFVTTLDWIGRITTVVFIVTLIYGIYAWTKGVLPALIRLGNGLSSRKVAVFAKGDHLGSLEGLLLDSSLFNKKNMISITSEGDFGRAERATVFLVFWHDWQDKMTEVLSLKKDTTALVVYAPPELGGIPADKFKELNTKRNVTVANVRGRLLNDVIISLMTTSYQ